MKFCVYRGGKTQLGTPEVVEGLADPRQGNMGPCVRESEDGSIVTVRNLAGWWPG